MKRVACVKWLERGPDHSITKTGWCAVEVPDPDQPKTLCGYHVIFPLDSANRRPTCPQCIELLTRTKATKPGRTPKRKPA